MPDKHVEIDTVIYQEGEGKNKIFSISSMQVPNVVTQGKSIEEAKTRLKEALELYFEGAPWEKKNLIKVSKKHGAPMIGRLLV